MAVHFLYGLRRFTNLDIVTGSALKQLLQRHDIPAHLVDAANALVDVQSYHNFLHLIQMYDTAWVNMKGSEDSDYDGKDNTYNDYNKYFT